MENQDTPESGPKKDVQEAAGNAGEPVQTGTGTETNSEANSGGTPATGSSDADPVPVEAGTEKNEGPAEPQDGPPEVGGGAEVEIPQAHLKDLKEILEDETGIFDQGPIKLLSRQEVVQGLIVKHNDLIARYTAEIEGGVGPGDEVTSSLESARDQRDSLNAKVHELKENRNLLKQKNRELRKEFLRLIRIEEALKDKAREISAITDFIDRQEYKLQTEGVDLETERRLMKDIRDSMEELRSISGGYLPQDVESDMTNLTDSIKENFNSIEDLHNTLIKLAEESQVHHQRFMEENKKVRESESRKAWLGRRITLHEEMRKFWEGQLEANASMDAADAGRSIDGILSAMLKELEEAEKAQDGSNDPPGPKDRKGRTGKGQKGRDQDRGEEGPGPAPAGDGSEGTETPPQDQEEGRIDDGTPEVTEGDTIDEEADGSDRSEGPASVKGPDGEMDGTEPQEASS